MNDQEFTEAQLIELYGWVDTIPLSRKKKNLARDFSDAVLMAEIISNFYPKMVDLHNYQQGLRYDSKLYNWKYLNDKVLRKLKMPLNIKIIQDLAASKPGVIENVLWSFKEFVVSKSKKVQKYYFDEDDLFQPPPQHIEKFTKAHAIQDRKMLEEKMQECEEQAEYIEALETKVSKLEELLRLKDAKINKLTRALEKQGFR